MVVGRPLPLLVSSHRRWLPIAVEGPLWLPVVINLVLVGGTLSPSAAGLISLVLALPGPVADPLTSLASVLPGASPHS